MSSTLKDGDICVVIDSPCTHGAERALIGKECVVIGLVDNPLAVLAMVLSDFKHMIFTVRFADGRTFDLCHNSLRKKQPPAEQGSWLAIQKIPGWVPKKKPEAVPA